MLEDAGSEALPPPTQTKERKKQTQSKAAPVGKTEVTSILGVCCSAPLFYPLPLLPSPPPTRKRIRNRN